MDGGKYKIIKGGGHIEAHQKKDTSDEQSRNNLRELVWEQDLLMSRENLKVGIMSLISDPNFLFYEC